jgi:hypothetical protein
MRHAPCFSLLLVRLCSTLWLKCIAHINLLPARCSLASRHSGVSVYQQQLVPIGLFATLKRRYCLVTTDTLVRLPALVTYNDTTWLLLLQQCPRQVRVTAWWLRGFSSCQGSCCPSPPSNGRHKTTSNCICSATRQLQAPQAAHHACACVQACCAVAGARIKQQMDNYRRISSSTPRQFHP